ncbi:MATE family efflux transporter [Novacetimonas hansenii]|uniref:MATE family efflux transporter n=1 Tax=Novacetimonas hansenii TaxID=436 RepID=UPI00094F7FEC|nr:MATE family efflux transporter [Novacetimonas hansenii]
MTRRRRGTSTRCAAFCQGSIMRHVIVMAGTGAIGLMAVFMVDLLNLFYISTLHNPAMTAAIGFTAAVGFIQIAVSIGMSIGLGATTSRQIGAGHHDMAQRIASSFSVVMLLLTGLLGFGTALLAHPILHALGAQGEAEHQAALYLYIASPMLPLIAVGMGASSLLRAVGAAQQSMNVTLAGALISALLDPVLILWLHFELQGAAISTLISRAVVAGLGIYCARQHDLLAWPVARFIRSDTHRVGQIAMPAILTNLATPIGGIFVTHAMASFGLSAVAGQATIDRIVPVAFAFVFALTGSIGPIMSQNLGAGQVGRVHETLVASLKLVLGCVGLTWAILFVGQDLVIRIFSATGTTADLIRLFCNWTIGGYFFIGILFVANSAFNNLGHPLYSTLFNWGRATLGTVPFVWIGMQYGPMGVQVGQVLGSVLFGIGAVTVAFSVVRNLKVTSPEPQMDSVPSLPPAQSAESAMIELDDLDNEAQEYEHEKENTQD